MRWKSEEVEFRGVSEHKSAKGNTYYYAHFETASTEQKQYYLKDLELIAHLVKGDMCILHGDDTYDKLQIIEVEKV